MPSFAEALYSLSAEELHTLVRARGVDPNRLALIADKRSLVQMLASELTKQLSVVTAIRRCNARELRLLQLASTDESARGFEWSVLVDMAGGEALEPALGGIAEQLKLDGLLFRVGPTVYVPDMVRRQTPASLTDRYTLARLLNAYDAPAIRRIADKLGLEEDNRSKSGNIEAICSSLLASISTLRFSTPLTDAELGVINFLVQRNGSATALDIIGAVSDGTPDDFFRYEWQNRWKQGKEKNAVDSLLARGIVHVTTSGYGYNLHIVIPGDLLKRLTGSQNATFWNEPEPQPVRLQYAPTQTRANAALIRDVVSMLSFFAVQSAVRTNTGHIHKASLKAIARHVSISDEVYAAFLYAICRDAGLAAPEGERQAYTLTAAGKRWLQSDTSTQITTLFAAWRDGATWAEMYAEPLMRNNEYRSRDTVVEARRAVLAILKSSPDGGSFIDIDSIATTAVFRFPLLLTGSFGGGLAAGSTLAVFCRDLIVECLYWLGVVELGWKQSSAARLAPDTSSSARDPAAQPDSFRATGSGNHLLYSGEATESAPRESAFVVQANAEIIIPPFLEPTILYRLLCITELPAHSGAVSTTLLTRESIRRALDLGENTRNMLSFLMEHSRTGVPQNVEYLINEVGGKHGHIRVGNAQAYLCVDSPVLLKELQSRRELKGYFLRALSDSVAILDCDDIDKVLKDLRKAGYLPISDDAKPHLTITPGRKQPEAPERKPKPAAIGDTDPYGSVEWERIGADDGKSWNQQPSPLTNDVTMPNGAYDNPNLIRVMLHNACLTHNVVDLVWRQAGREAVRVLFEPNRMSGSSVRGYVQNSDQLTDLDIATIRWAKLTPVKF